MQCLANIFKEDVIFKGVMLTNETLKLTMFADDILLFILGKEDQFERIFTILHDFAIHSDCKLNMAKCQAFRVGSNRDSFDKPYLDKGLQWPKEIFKYLGISVLIKKSDGNDKKLMDLNCANVIDKTKSILNLWSCRNLTLIGKITILKNLVIGLPQVTYKASMLPVIFPKNFITKINKLMYQFVWGSKWERVGRNVFCSSLEKGGANMIHLQSYLTALHAKYLSCLFSESFFSQWKTIESLFFDHNLLYAVLTSNLKV